MRLYGGVTEQELRKGVEDSYAAIPELLEEIDHLRRVIFLLHETSLQFATRLVDEGLYGFPDDLAGGKNQRALALAKNVVDTTFYE